VTAQLTMAELLELHPWPKGYEDAKKIERLWVYDLPGTPKTIWPFISDTSRMNRALGTAEMTFREKDGKRYGSSKAGGGKHEWVEVPWAWVPEQWPTNLPILELHGPRTLRLSAVRAKAWHPLDCVEDTQSVQCPLRSDWHEEARSIGRVHSASGLSRRSRTNTGNRRAPPSGHSR